MPAGPSFDELVVIGWSRTCNCGFEELICKYIHVLDPFGNRIELDLIWKWYQSVIIYACLS